MADETTLPQPDDPDYGTDDQTDDSDETADIDESTSPLAERYKHGVVAVSIENKTQTKDDEL